MVKREDLEHLIAEAQRRLDDPDLPEYQREYFENMLLDYKEQLKSCPEPKPEGNAPLILSVIKGGKQ